MKYNQILGFVLIFGILIGFSIWNAPSKEERQKEQARKDSIAKVKLQQDSLNAVAMAQAKDSSKSVKDSAAKQTTPAANVAVNDTAAIADSTSKFNFEKDGVFYTSLDGTDTNYVVETPLMRVTIASKGASIKQIELKEFLTWDKKPLKMFYKGNNYFDFSFHTSKSLAKTSAIYFKPAKGFGENKYSTEVSEDSMLVTFRAPAVKNDGTETGAVLFNYTFYKDSYLFRVGIAFENRENIIGSGNQFMTIDWNADLETKEKIGRAHV